MIKYRTGGSSPIKPIEVLRETDKFIVIMVRDWKGERERRESKRGGYHSYFNTWKEARDFLIEDANQYVKAKERQLEFALSKLNEAIAVPEQENEEGVE